MRLGTPSDIWRGGHYTQSCVYPFFHPWRLLGCRFYQWTEGLCKPLLPGWKTGLSDFESTLFSPPLCGLGSTSRELVLSKEASCESEVQFSKECESRKVTASSKVEIRRGDRNAMSIKWRQVTCDSVEGAHPTSIWWHCHTQKWLRHTDFPFPSWAITKVYGTASGTAVQQPTGREIREH